MNTIQMEKVTTDEQIEQAAKIVEQDKADRSTRVMTGLAKLLEENNCDITVEMAVPFMGRDIVVSDKMLPPEKVKITIVPK